MEKDLTGLMYDSIDQIRGPLLFVNGGKDLPSGSLVEILSRGGARRRGQVLEVSETSAVIQVMEGTAGLGAAGTMVRLESAVIQAGVSRAMKGRILDGMGRPRDGKPAPVPEVVLPVAGLPMNPVLRTRPDEFIQTGISTIDCFNTLVRGQKLPVFSQAGLPSAELVLRIISGAGIEDPAKFLIIFAAMGITRREQSIYMRSLAGTGSRLLAFLNLADDPVIERLLTPRFALTAAEYFAFTLDHHVLVIMSDMTNYCAALREVSSAKEEVPGRRGYPGYMYTDLSTIYERAGRLKGSKGSITQIPVLTVPDGDITHPIPDLTGYITEGQIVMTDHLHKQGIFPPIDILPSLSRLMNSGIGQGKTREDHRAIANQMYACYSRGIDVRRLATIIGDDAISPGDRRYLDFSTAFEDTFINQGQKTRDIVETLDLGWSLLKSFPADELTRIDRDMISRYFSVILGDGTVSRI